MRQRVLDVLRGLVVAFAAIATATVLTIVLWRLQVDALTRVAPFFFLIAVLACSWAGGYTAGISSVIFAHIITLMVSRRAFDPGADLYRLALLLMTSAAVSWIAAHRRHLETELRAGVDQKTAELRAAVESMEHEVQERKVAEDEIRRLNHLLEIRVDERTRQLEASNQELESFSYSVSHDLRAPLRSIDGFSRILLGTCSVKLDEEERMLFQRVLAATTRMNTLIDDLLNLARVTRTAMHAGTVDLSQLAKRIAAELQGDHPESHATFVIEPGLTANGDSNLVEVALHNLLENAWKFSSQSPEPRVEFGSTSIGEERVLFVKDNGAGFNPLYKDKLFTPFQRLHRQEEFPGTGIGLATVSRIVHRHGGWISAESEPGQGATFFFTLASPPPKAVGNEALYLPEEPKPPAPLSEAASSSSTQSALM
jgi:signal transduction histidine kinase